jgi:hypothetical protein
MNFTKKEIEVLIRMINKEQIEGISWAARGISLEKLKVKLRSIYGKVKSG